MSNNPADFFIAAEMLARTYELPPELLARRAAALRDAALVPHPIAPPGSTDDNSFTTPGLHNIQKPPPAYHDPHTTGFHMEVTSMISARPYAAHVEVTYPDGRKVSGIALTNHVYIADETLANNSRLFRSLQPELDPNDGVIHTLNRVAFNGGYLTSAVSDTGAEIHWISTSETIICVKRGALQRNLLEWLHERVGREINRISWANAKHPDSRFYSCSPHATSDGTPIPPEAYNVFEEIIKNTPTAYTQGTATGRFVQSLRAITDITLDTGRNLYELEPQIVASVVEHLKDSGIIGE